MIKSLPSAQRYSLLKHDLDIFDLAVEKNDMRLINDLFKDLSFKEKYSLLQQTERYKPTTLSIAIRQKSFTIIDLLLKDLTSQNLLNVLMPGENHNSVIDIYRSNREILKDIYDRLLPEHKFDLLQQYNPMGNTQLYLACLYGHPETIHILLDKLSSDQVFSLSQIVGGEEGLTPIEEAINQKEYASLTALISHLSSEKIMGLIDLTYSNSPSIFYKAVQEGDLKIIDILMNTLSSEQKNHLIDGIAGEGWPALHVAAHYGKSQLIENLLNHSTPEHRIILINQANAEGQTIFRSAFLVNDYHLVDILLKSLNATERLPLIQANTLEDFPALHLSAYNGWDEMINTLLNNLTPEQKTIALKQTTTRDGWSALELAKNANQIQILSILEEATSTT